MNIVVFSYHFLPKASAESFCTTRFASALAAAGHNVHVVTMDCQREVSDAVYEKLVDRRLMITRVPMRKIFRPPLWSRLLFLTHEFESVNVLRGIAALRKVLRTTEHPVLVSRTHPLASLIVSWYCRDFAEKWIAHFSDPIPFYGGRLKRFLMRLWCKRAFRSANGISVTCDNAVRFYRENYGADCHEYKFFVTPHIGDPWLVSDEHYNKPDDLPMVAHTGLFYEGRGAVPLINAIGALNHEGCECRFVQVGEVDMTLRSEFEKAENVLHIDDMSPSLSTAVVEASDVLFISDVQIPGDYIPYMPSKFVYQLFTDKPMVVYTKRDSPMGRFCQHYGSAGLFFADSNNPEDLRKAIKLAVDAARNSCSFDRSGIRREFSSWKVASEFVDNVMHCK